VSLQRYRTPLQDNSILCLSYTTFRKLLLSQKAKLILQGKYSEPIRLSLSLYVAEPSSKILCLSSISLNLLKVQRNIPVKY